MKMKPKHYLFLALVISSLTAVLLGFVSVAMTSAPKLLLSFDGQPASLAQATLPGLGGKVVRFDTTGCLQSREFASQIIFVRGPGGQNFAIRFPNYANKRVDISDNVVRTWSTEYWGLVPTYFEQANLPQNSTQQALPAESERAESDK